jgi:hypothetical protein
MANELQIQIGATYILDGDIFELVDVEGPYFILIPLKINNAYHTSNDGSIVMKAIHFSKAKRYTGI